MTMPMAGFGRDAEIAQALGYHLTRDDGSSYEIEPAWPFRWSTDPGEADALVVEVARRGFQVRSHCWAWTDGTVQHSAEVWGPRLPGGEERHPSFLETGSDRPDAVSAAILSALRGCP